MWRTPRARIPMEVSRLPTERLQRCLIRSLRGSGNASGILRNAGHATPSPVSSVPLAAEERELVKRLAEFPGIVAEATERRAPHAIPTFAIRVADDFHRFYHQHKVLGSESEAFRLGLCTATRSVVASCLDLIGVEAPDHM